MSKIVYKKNIGIHKISRLEVESTPDDKLSNTFYDENKIVNLNCNGPHVPFVVVDEIDTVSGEGIKAFKDISGMIDSKGTKKSLRIGISTRKTRYGLMNAQIENAAEEGRTVRMWTAFEFSERCPDERSGTDPIDLYILQDKLLSLTQEQYDRKDKIKQKEFKKYTFPGSNCQHCAAAGICLGDAKKQTSRSPMLKPITDLINKVKKEGCDWALAQLMNLKPSIEGIIYREFEEKTHVKTWNQMWKILTGHEYPGECTHNIFVSKCHTMNLPCYAGIDWGWSKPSTVVFMFIDKKDNIYVVKCDGLTYTNQPKWVHYIKTKYHSIYRTQLYYPDTADGGAVDVCKNDGLPTYVDNVKHHINDGVQVIKKFLSVPGQEQPKIFFNDETCRPIIDEFNLYHYKTNAAGEITDTPEENSDDHWLDALRYAIYMLFGKSQFNYANSASDSMEGLVDQQGRYSRAPSASEYAATTGLPFDDVANMNDLGKIEKTKDIISDEEDINGGGNFLWSM